MKNSTLNNSAILFFTVLMAAVIFCAITSRNYQISNRAVAGKAMTEGFVSYESLYYDYLQDIDNGFLLVDLRYHAYYEESHLAGAHNIPFDELLQRNHQRKLKKYDNILLYADQEQVSVAAQMLLLGAGIENVRVIPGTYSTIMQYVVEAFDPSRAFYNEDKARWDHQRFMPVGGGETKKQPETSPSREGMDPTAVIGGC
ncbi:MAG: rhodanese-like domain-containing protein [Bacteroidia bacterium]|nr:MAG: rhodanese-like domain-containing protein [Bacteroidia bacterium]